MSDCTYKTKLLRQIPKQYYDRGKISTGAFLARGLFTPRDCDNGELSVHNEDMINAEDAYKAYTENFQSIGVTYVTIGQCTDLNLTTKPAPSKVIDRESTNVRKLKEAHHVIDYNKHEKKHWKMLATKLRDFAEKAGFLVGPFEG